MMRVIACNAMALFIKWTTTLLHYGVEYVTLISDKNKQKE